MIHALRVGRRLYLVARAIATPYASLDFTRSQKRKEGGGGV